MQNNNFPNGEKGSHNIIIRVSPRQHEQVKVLAEMNGYKTISSFVRSKILESPLIEKRITEIYQILVDKKLNKKAKV